MEVFMSVAEWVDEKMTLELKKKLHRQIDELHDVKQLSRLEYLLDEENDDDDYVHTPEEEAIIDEALRELDAGLGIPLAEVLRHIEEERRRLWK